MIYKNHLIAILLTLSAGIAQAAPVIFNATGDVETADTGNDFGLTITDFISASGEFNDAGFTMTGLESFELTSLSLTVGNIDFFLADQEAPGTAEIVFEEGLFLGINFFTVADVDGPIAFFDTAFDYFNGEDDNFGFIDGTWVQDSYSVVPVPAAAWLFGSGLLGLVGLARRKAA